MIEVLETPGANTVQDLGRFGYRRFGVNTAGAMDALALQVGNALLGNAPGDAVIEVQTFPFCIRFEKETGFALTGADVAARLDGLALPPWWAMRARRGQVLTLAAPSAGARVYVAVTGGIAVPPVLGSRSTHLRAGFGGLGRALAPGDRLPVGGGSLPPSRGVEPPASALPPAAPGADAQTIVLRAIPATDHDRFPAEAQARFWSTPWRVTPQSDRAGYRLAGEPLMLPAPLELRSYGVVPGIVQIPPGGAPIVQMADANTAGGYPRMAAVIEADLWRLAQARMGMRVRFFRVDYADGVAAMRPVADWLERVRRAAGSTPQAA